MAQRTHMPARPAGPRGAVLLFAVVLLTLLLGIGVAFILYMRQESRASANAAQGTQAQAAAETGLNHALLLLRQAALTYDCLSPDGAFAPENAASATPPSPGNLCYLDPNGGGLRKVEAPAGQYSVSQVVIRSGASYMTDPDSGHAWLFWHPDGNECGAAGHELAGMVPMRYSSSPLAHYSYPNGATKQYRDNAPEHAGLARRFLCRQTRDILLNDFYADPNTGRLYSSRLNSLPTPLGVGTGSAQVQNAEYYVWIADLDGKLFIRPQGDMSRASWNDPLPSTDPGWGLTTLPPVANSANFTPATMATRVVGVVDAYGNSPSSAGWLTGTQFPGMQLNSAQCQTVPYLPWILAPGRLSVGEVAVELGVVPVDNLGKWAYLAQRYGMERYFTLYQDTLLTSADRNRLGVNLTHVKDHAAALNVNTAPLEMLAAALSQIPLVPTYDPLVQTSVTQNVTKAYALAGRICAKRPFLCRMDFEDFLAAHVNLVEPATEAQVDNIELTPPGAPNPVTLLYRAIARRDWHTTSLAAQDPAAVLDPATNLIPLSDLAEIDGLPESDSRYKKLRDRDFLRKRFCWFRDYYPNGSFYSYRAEGCAPLYASSGVFVSALLTPRALNNVLNSLCGPLRMTKAFSGSTNLTTSTPHGLRTGDFVTTDPRFAVVYTNTIPNTTVPANYVHCTAPILPSALSNQFTLHATLADATAGASPGTSENGSNAGMLVFDPPPNVNPELYRYGYSFYSFDVVHLPCDPAQPQIPAANAPREVADMPFHYQATRTINAVKQNYDVVPKFAYQQLRSADIASGAGTMVYMVGSVAEPMPATLPAPGAGELMYWRPTNTSAYYELTFSASNDEQKVEYLKDDGVKTGVAPHEYIVFVHSNGTLATPPVQPDVVQAQEVCSVENPSAESLTCHTTVHGPLRAYRHDVDNALQAPTFARMVLPNLLGDTDGPDVSWSPRFAYRSRFFMVYVLARALDPKGQPLPGGERRLEAAYDAVKDQVLWRRWQLTEKRAVWDPEP